jgi:type 1 glutamine amidotransferase
MRALTLLPLLLLGAAPLPKDEVLIFSHTTGYRHDSIPAGIAATERIAKRQGFSVRASEDPALFTSRGLRGVRAIVFLSSTTDPKAPSSEWLTGERRAALQSFVRSGGGVLAVHAAADSHYGWPWYGRLIGGRFARHPEGTPPGTLTLADRSHPVTGGMPATIRRSDEWYEFADYDPTSRLLVTLDPASIGEADVNPNPISWVRQVDGGRVFYTAMGHTAESYSDPYVLRHLSNGLAWVTRRR